MGRRRKQEPKRNQYCLRLTDRQAELLRRYADFRDFDSEVDALRKMVDGLEDWLNRQNSRAELAGSSSVSSPPPAPAHSGLPSTAGDVAPSDVDDGDTSVGDFGGRPSIGLPDASWNDGGNE
jgi:hypothetical protein